MSSSIPSALAFGVYASQFICCAHSCSNCTTSSPGHLLPFCKRLHGQQILFRVMRSISSRSTSGPENQVANYIDFLSCNRPLVTRLLSQGCKVNRLSNTFKRFSGRHTDLVAKYNKNVFQMFVDYITQNAFHFLWIC